MKKYFIQTFIATLVITVLIVVLFGSLISAKLSTLPGLRRFHFLSPQAPIVINRREEVRVSDSGDVQAAINSVKSKLSGIATVTDGHVTVLGNALNLTSDGLFVTAKAAVTGFQQGRFYVVGDSGDPVVIDSIVPDSATNLAFVSAHFSNLPVVDFSSSKVAGTGQKLVFIAHGSLNFTPSATAGYLTTAQKDVLGQVFHAGLPSRSFTASTQGSLVPGEAIVGIDGSVIGIWDGSAIIPSDVIRSTMDLFFSDKTLITRPSFGFDYHVVTKTESLLRSVPEGAEVIKVVKKDPQTGKATPVGTAGLTEGDVIIQVGDNKISENVTLEETLEKTKPGDNLSFTVHRGTQTLILTFSPGTLK